MADTILSGSIAVPRASGQVETPSAPIGDTAAPAGEALPSVPVEQPAIDPAAADGGMNVTTAEGFGSSLNPLSALNGGSSQQVIKVYPEASGGYGHGHYIVFHINEQTSAAWANPNAGSGGLKSPAGGVISSVTSGVSGAVGAVRGGIDTATGLPGSVTDTVTNMSTNPLATVGSTLGSAREAIEQAPGQISAFGSSVNSLISDGVNRLLTRPTKRTNTTIALYMPDTVNFDQHISYNSTSMSDAFGLLGAGLSVAAAWGGRTLNPTSGTQANRALMPLLAASSLVNTLAPGLRDAKDIILQNGVGVAENPLNVLLFKQVEFRKFQFDFLLTPESPKEASTILDIIKLFRKNSLPEIITGTAGRFFVPPNDFDISFMNNGTINSKIPKISTCVLSNINCNYAVNGVWQTYADGMPTQISMSLMFEETEILTQSKVGKGY